MKEVKTSAEQPQAGQGGALFRWFWGEKRSKKKKQADLFKNRKDPMCFLIFLEQNGSKAVIVLSAFRPFGDHLLEERDLKMSILCLPYEC